MFPFCVQLQKITNYSHLKKIFKRVRKNMDNQSANSEFIL